MVKRMKIYKKFKKTIYFKSLNGFSLKEVYASLLDFSFLLVMYLLVNFFSMIIQNLDTSSFSNVQLNNVVDSNALSGIVSFTTNWIYLISLLIIISILVYSFSRMALYKQFMKIKLTWKLFFKNSLITLISLVIFILFLLIIPKLFIEIVSGFIILLLLIFFAYMMTIIYIKFLKEGNFKSAWQGFKLSFYKFHILFFSYLLSFITVIFVSLIITSILTILNFKNSNVTTTIISFIGTIILFLGFAWMRRFMVLKVKDLEKKK